MRKPKITALLSKLKKVRKSKDGWVALCPAHNDHKPSLSLRIKGSHILLHCFAGCDVHTICKALGISFSDLYDDSAIYPYQDEKGKTLFEVVRENKKFRVRVKEGRKYVYSLNGIPKIPFNLPDVLRAIAEGKDIYITEGEKDALTVISLGEVATTNYGGALSVDDNFIKYFRGARVKIVVDKDKTGYERGRLLFTRLKNIAKSVQILEPLSGKDLTEHVELGYDLKSLVSFGRSYVLSSSLVEESLKKFLMEPYFPFGLTLLDGLPGCGKSWFVALLASRVSRGLGLFENEKRKGNGKKVLIVSYEDDYSIVKERIEMCKGDLEKIDFGVSLPLLPEGIENFELVTYANGYDLIIVDPLFGVLSDSSDVYNDVRVKKLFGKLNSIGWTMKSAIVGVRHLAKSAYKKEILSGLGGIGIAGSARSVILAEKKGKVFSFSHIKSNYAKLGPKFRMIVDGRGVRLAR